MAKWEVDGLGCYCVDTLAPCHVQSTSQEVGATATVGMSRKRNTYFSPDKKNGGVTVDGGGGCSENSLTIVAENKLEEDHTADPIIPIEEKHAALSEPDKFVAPPVSHPAQCSCHNCEEILSRFAECGICLEPLQCGGACACAWCGGVWCARCSRRVSRCAWCRAPLRSPARPCPALQRLLDDMLLPCRNFRRGCAEILTSATRRQHEEDCQFDQICCPLADNCRTGPFDNLSAHLRANHNIIAVYSQKIKILIENFQTKLKKTACCRTKYKIVLLHNKSAFVIKVCIYNYNVRVEVMRKRLGYSAEKDSRKSDYCALIEFQSKALSTKSAVLIENEAYSKKAEVRWSEVALPPDGDEAITIHVSVAKSQADPQ